MARPSSLFRLLFLICALVSVLSARSVVVLPLISNSDQNKYSWIGESVPEVLSEILSTHGIFILDREQRLKAYRTLSIRESSPKTLATNLKIAVELDAEFAVFGSFQLTEEETLAESPLVLDVRVMDVRKWRKVGEIRLEGTLGELGVLQTRLGYLLLKAIAPGDPASEAEFLARHPAVRLDALENYVRGLMADSDEARHRFLTQAARLDESYGAPVFQLGQHYWQLGNHRQASAWLKRLPRDHSQFREAQFMLGVCDLNLGNYAEAEAVFRELFEAVPMAEVANNLSVSLARQGKAEAFEALLKATTMEPEDADYRFNLGLQLWRQERYDYAAERFREVLELSPDDAEATRMLGRSLQKEGSRPARNAVSHLDRVKATIDDAQFTILNARAASRPKN